MDAWEIVAIVIGVAILLALVVMLIARVRQGRRVKHFERVAVERQEDAADRIAESEALQADAEQDRRIAQQAAERARELEAEADRRAEHALEVEAEADAVRGEADEQLTEAQRAEAEAHRLRR